VNNALQGVHVLVTRPSHQAESLCQLIEQQGGIAVRFPTLEVVEMNAKPNNESDNPAIATNPLSKLSNYRWLVFISANAVNFALKANGGKIARFKSVQIAAIGQATANALIKSGLQVNLLPKTGFDSDSLLAMPELQLVNGQNILIVRGQGGREQLATVLRSRGANVDYWEVYQRIMPDVDNAKLGDLLEQNKLNVIVITSCEALQNLQTMLGSPYTTQLTAVSLVVVSDRIKRFAIEMGFTRIAVTEYPSDSAILDALCVVINRVC
jgi:uroporphyrinogen-III synthase